MGSCKKKASCTSRQIIFDVISSPYDPCSCQDAGTQLQYSLKFSYVRHSNVTGTPTVFNSPVTTRNLLQSPQVPSVPGQTAKPPIGNAAGGIYAINGCLGDEIQYTIYAEPSCCTKCNTPASCPSTYGKPILVCKGTAYFSSLGATEITIKKTDFKLDQPNCCP